MTTPNVWSYAEARHATAWHEAGHAVVASVVGQPVLYATLRPRDGAAGTVRYSGYMPERPWNWRDAGAVSFAGIAAEQTVESSRADLVYGGYYDLRNARCLARAVLVWRDRTQTAEVDPGWSEWDVGAFMWRYAVGLVTEHLDAIACVASLLLTERRAVTGRRIRAVLAGSERVAEPPAVGDAEWWIPRHTRMQWRGAA